MMCVGCDSHSCRLFMGIFCGPGRVLWCTSFVYVWVLVLCFEYVFCLWAVRCLCLLFFFFKQKTAYEMRISDWSSDVCSSDLHSHWDRRGALGCASVGQSEVLGVAPCGSIAGSFQSYS